MPGWQDVLEAVVRDRRSALVGYAALFTGNRRDAEDLVHDAVVRTFARPRSLTDVHTAEAYVRQAVRTSFLDGARRHRTWRSRAHLFVVDADSPSPEHATTAVIDVRAALGDLAPRERAVAVLRYFDDLPLAEIAHELGLSPGAVKRYLFDATTKLRAALGPDALPEDDPASTTPWTIHRTGRSDA